MRKKPTFHLIIDTSSCNEFNNGDCDFGLIPLTPAYIKELLRYQGMVAFLHWADDRVYNLEYFDDTCRFFRDNDKLRGLQDIHDHPIEYIIPHDPIILGRDPEIAEDDFQPVACQSVSVGAREFWWVGFVKHTNIRIETAHIDYRLLRKIQNHPTCRHDRSSSD